MLSFYCALQEALIFDIRLVRANQKEIKRMSVVIVGGNARRPALHSLHRVSLLNGSQWPFDI